MKSSAKKSVFESLGFQEVSNSSKKADDYRFEVVEGSNTVFSKADLAKITKCILRVCTNSFSNKEEMKLLIEAKGKKSNTPQRLWVKLDGITYKRYKDNANCSIDPSKVCIYMLHDPEGEYGDEDGNWQVCRIKVGALTDAPNDSDAALFGE